MARTEVDLLADLERELADLQTTITVLRRKLGVEGPPVTPAPSVAGRGPQGEPFLGMSVLSASRKFLQQVEEPRSANDIAGALQAGGVHSRSSDFEAIVRTTLHKRGAEVGIEKFDRGMWGLIDWRPSGRRPNNDGE